jgi:hypothetical protein
MTRQLDLIPREELRGEIRRFEEHVLELGKINGLLFHGIDSVLETLVAFTIPEDTPTQEAIKVLQKIQRVARRRLVRRRV